MQLFPLTCTPASLCVLWQDLHDREAKIPKHVQHCGLPSSQQFCDCQVKMKMGNSCLTAAASQEPCHPGLPKTLINTAKLLNLCTVTQYRVTYMNVMVMKNLEEVTLSECTRFNISEIQSVRNLWIFWQNLRLLYSETPALVLAGHCCDF